MNLETKRSRKVMTMSSNVLGRKVAKIALSYAGARTGDKKHRDLVDTFNKEHPNGQHASYSDYWCAIAWTAWQLKAGLTHDDVPMGYNVPQLVQQAKDRGIWVEDDKHAGRPGDGIVYDWQDSGAGDNKGGPDHIGTIYKVSRKTIYVIEGNAGDQGICKRRAVPINGRYIRGFICPRYNAIYIDWLARRYAWPKGTDKKKFAVKGGKPCMKFRKAWKKRFPKRKIGSGCHQYVMLVMRVAGYKVMPLAWSKIIKYLKERCKLIKFEHKASQLRKGDIMIYKRVDSNKKAHYHIWIVVEVGGKLMMAQANQGLYYAHITPSLSKALKKYAKTYLFRAKESK